MARNIANSIVGDKPQNRHSSDFYRTPEEAVDALLLQESIKIGSPFQIYIREPACGDGAISNTLEMNHHIVLSSDLYDRGYGIAGINFLNETHEFYKGKEWKYDLITNPPFSLANQFILKAYSLPVRKIAFLMKLTALEGKVRSEILEFTQLSRIHVFRTRINMYPEKDKERSKNGGMIAFAWFIWNRSQQQDKSKAPEIYWIGENESNLSQDSLFD